MDDTFLENILRLIRAGREKYGSARALGQAAGVDPVNISRWLNGSRKPRVEEVAPILDALGAKILLPEDLHKDAGRDVCFVDARVVPAGSGQRPPAPEDYMAVPLVEEVGAGPGIIPQGELLSWFLVYKHQDAVRYRQDLIAVKIGRHSTSMMPTLSPGDMVLVDRADRDTRRPGRMMLVLDPDGEGKIKRVAVDQHDNDYRITYYSDNAADNPPEIYSFKKDFLSNWDRAIAGRVVWAWSDISNK